MNKPNKARKHSSSKLQALLNEITPLEMEQTKIKMQLAARIEELMRSKGMKKSQFAEKLGKNPSEITKWLSGTQNFTTDILTEIAWTLGIELNTLFIQQQVHVVATIQIKVGVKTSSDVIKFTTPLSPNLQGTCFFTSQGESTSYSQLHTA